MSNNRAVIDRREALERVGGDLELLVTLAEVYLEDEDETTTSLQRALASGDAEAMVGAAHKLKGDVANFGAHACVEAALRLEVMGRSGELEDGPEAWTELEAELKKLREGLVELEKEANSPRD